MQDFLLADCTDPSQLPGPLNPGRCNVPPASSQPPVRDPDRDPLDLDDVFQRAEEVNTNNYL